MRSTIFLFVMLFGLCPVVLADDYVFAGLDEELSISEYYRQMNGGLEGSSFMDDFFGNESGFHLVSFTNYASDGGAGGSESPSSSGRINDARKHIELMPYAGFTFGGSFDDKENDEDLDIDESSSYGFRIAYDTTYDSQISGYNTQVEFIFSRQETEVTTGGLFPEDAEFDLDVSYYHIGGTIFMNKNSKVEPYFNGSLGVTNFDPGDSDMDSLTRFSMGFGGGVRYFPIERLGLTLGARGLLTFVDSEFTSYSESAGTHIKIESDVLWQFQLYGGVVFVF